jgi:NAD-dependent SIR2 family protein deacetylase
MAAVQVAEVQGHLWEWACTSCGQWGTFNTWRAAHAAAYKHAVQMRHYELSDPESKVTP